MKRSISKRLLSILLAFALFTSLTAVSAETAGFSDVIETRQLSDADIPEVISDNVIDESNHVERLYKEEDDLSTVIFANDDDTNTVYFFDEPVKYIAEDGTVQDKSSILYDSFDIPEYNEFAYVNLDNDIRTFFPEELSEDSGVTLVADDYVIELSPVSEDLSSVTLNPEDENSVVYDGAFGNDTAVQYTTLFNGFKEDIVMYENVGNEFSFILKTNGLVAQIDGMNINLTDPVSGAVVAVADPIYVYDSSEISNSTFDNKIELELREDGDYEVKIIADNDFLSNPETVYPVYVDPTITIIESYTGSTKNIQDLMLSSDSTAALNVSFAIVGKNQGQSNYMRMLMRFPGVMNDPAVKTLPASSITNATLYLQTSLSSSTRTTVTPYYYTGPSNWIETTLNSNTQFNSYGAAINTGVDLTSGLIGLDITNAVKTWKSNPTSANQGLILKNSNETSDSYSKSFQTSEASTGKPYVKVTYQLNDKFSEAETITLNQYKNVDIFLASQKLYYKFTPSATGLYTIESSSSNTDAYAWLYNSAQTQLAYNDDGAGSLNFRLIYHLEGGKTYYIAAGCFSSRTGNYQFKITPTLNTNLSVISSTTISKSVSQSVNITATAQKMYYTFTPTSAGTYTFQSLNIVSGDPRGYLYDSMGNLLASSDDYGGTLNFLMTVNLTANQKVYLVAGGFSGNLANYSVLVS
jgi:hypothetical protein